MKTRLFIAFIVLASAGLTAQQPADWTEWRGPNRDGSVPSFTAPAAWPDALTERWKTEIGLGYSSPLVVGDRVFTFSRQGDDEVVMALDVATGRQVWQTKYPAPYDLIRAAAMHGMGPKATPVFADGRLFTFGISGILSAFDASTGRRLWQKPAPAVGPIFTTSQSPLVDRGLLIVHVGGPKEGGLTAFDPATGNQVWQWTGDGPAYGSPIVAEFGGMRQVIAFTFQNLVGVSEETGEQLWIRPFRSRSDVNAITPIVYGDTVIVSGADAGVAALKVTRQGTRWAVEEVWKTDETYFHLSNFILSNDAIFGLASTGRGQYAILDAKTGAMLFMGEPRAADNAAFLKSGNLLLALEADGELLIADGTNRTAFTPIKRYTVANDATWGAPTISGNRILVKGLSSLALFTVN